MESPGGESPFGNSKLILVAQGDGTAKAWTQCPLCRGPSPARSEHPQQHLDPPEPQERDLQRGVARLMWKTSGKPLENLILAQHKTMPIFPK